MKLCGNPRTSTNKDKGLVFGYVQSGKTLSFITLAALARDNGYQLIIILAGTKKNLVQQSYERLNEKLVKRGKKEFHRKWAIVSEVKDPDKNAKSKDTIKASLEKWKEHERGKTTLLITVIKNTKRLKNLVTTLKSLDLTGVPTLIIDDEGGQASLNTNAYANQRKREKGELTENEVSTIYKRIRNIKDALPHHTFIQYTATPQAPLFINICDNLSPNFVQLLTPGQDYTGGKVFFKENSYNIKEIPDRDIDSKEKTLDAIPLSLLEAMRIFFVGVAAGQIFGEKAGNPRNRTMMVHPSRLESKHDTYFQWISIRKKYWERVFDPTRHDEDKTKEIELFNKAYNDLAKHIHNLTPFEKICENLQRDICKTVVQQLNTSSGVNTVDFDSTYAHILVGGQALDRGFTVEGLTVTYMPRSNKGNTNADTLQQRARFFGYKKDYIGFCRIYLNQKNIHLFNEYIEHEEDIRTRLQQHIQSGKHLNEMKRNLYLMQCLTLPEKMFCQTRPSKRSLIRVHGGK